MSKYGVFSGPNTGIYGPEKTPYLWTLFTQRINKHVDGEIVAGNAIRLVFMKKKANV